MVVAANHTYPPPRARRAPHEKSRTGCLTCRIRKVKCDETRPYCRRCTHSGRKCDGPRVTQIRFIQDRSVVSEAPPGLRHEISLVAPQHNHDERRAFYFFLHRAAPVFAGGVDSSFWLDLVPRLAQSSPFVWDSVVSISCLFEHVPHGTLETNFEPKSASIVNPDHEKAIKWYNRAIAGLRQHIEQRGIDPGLALLSCTLFISVEMQQRNVGNALNLIEIGYKLMGQSLSVSSTVQLSPNSAALDEVVTPFFSRHVVLMATLGNPRPPNWSCHVEENMLKSSVLASFSVLDEPKRHLYSIIYQAYEIIRVEQLEPTEERIIKMQCLRQKLLLEDLRQWETSFVNTWSHETRREIVWAVSNLLMYWGVCYIWLSTCTTRLQSAFDEYSERFATILDHAENVLKYSIESTAGQPIFTSEAGPIPPLYFCAIKCRDPLLRRRALVLMRRAPRRESVWAYVPTEKVIEKVIGLEEGDYDATHIEMTGPPLLPPEENRIHHIAVVRKGAVGDTRRLALQLSKYIVGPPDNSRRMVHENVWLEEMTDHQYSP